MAFSQFPGDFNRAAIEANCDYRTARVAWETGWPELSWARAIKETVDLDIKLARVRLMEEQHRLREDKVKEVAEATISRAHDLALERERLNVEIEANLAKARADAAKAVVEESRMIRAARTNVTAVLVLANELLGSMKGLVDKTKVAIDRQEIDNPTTALRMLDRLTATIRTAADTAERAMAMERLLLGQPQQILEERRTAPAQTEDVSAEEAMSKIERAFRAVQELRKAGIDPSRPPIDVEAVGGYEEETDEPTSTEPTPSASPSRDQP
jgi:hypothetical protein